MATEWRGVALGLLTLLALPCHAQFRSALDPSGPDNAARLQYAAPRQVLVEGFNGLGNHAVELRRAMTPSDAEAFDAVMMDVMGALIALPCLQLRSRDHPYLLRPPGPRYDRIPQLDPDLQALDGFFARLQQTASSAADARMFGRARKNVRKMLAALPAAMPTLSARRLTVPLRK